MRGLFVLCFLFLSGCGEEEVYSSFWNDVPIDNDCHYERRSACRLILSNVDSVAWVYKDYRSKKVGAPGYTVACILLETEEAEEHLITTTWRHERYHGKGSTRRQGFSLGHQYWDSPTGKFSFSVHPTNPPAFPVVIRVLFADLPTLKRWGRYPNPCASARGILYDGMDIPWYVEQFGM